ncbi:MAG TPA: transglycosylase SLT domain-containing protein, partial [Herpetosiphonaceae bacterium]
MLLLVAVSFALGGMYAPRAKAQEGTPGRLNAAFQQAAKEFDVPRDLLMAIAYAETHFDDHNGAPSIDNGYGLMHLVDNPSVQTLAAAARLLGIAQDALTTDSVHNIRGGAALL